MLNTIPFATYQLHHALRTGNWKIAQAACQRYLNQVPSLTDKKVALLLRGILVKLQDRLPANHQTTHLIELLEQQYPALRLAPMAAAAVRIAETKEMGIPGEPSAAPVKILFLCSSPSDQHALRTDQEMRDIREGLSRRGSKQPIELITRVAVRLSDLRRALLETEAPIVHFSGHGNQRGIYLEDEQGFSYLFDVEALNKFFELFAHQITLVVLNSCHSWVPAQKIAAHIPVVIAMHGTLPDEAARIFAVAFYEAIALDCSCDFAFDYAQTTLHLEGFDGNLTRIIKNEQITQAKKPGFII